MTTTDSAPNDLAERCMKINPDDSDQFAKIISEACQQEDFRVELCESFSLTEDELQCWQNGENLPVHGLRVMALILVQDRFSRDGHDERGKRTVA